MKTIYKVILIVFGLLLLLSLSLNGYFIFKEIKMKLEIALDSTEELEESNEPADFKIAKQYDVIGLMYDSGVESLTSQNITTANYQVTFLAQNNTGLDVDGFFLLGSSGISENWGKCVGVNGTITDDWKTSKKIQDSYSRSAIVVSEINQLPFEECGGGYTKNTKAGDILEKFTGTVVHTKRPSPDISYDYEIQLETPYIDKYSASGLNPSVNSVIISPANFEVLTTIENSMSSKLTVSGYVTWGYAESTYFDIFNVITK